MKRGLFTILAALSLLLCVAVLVAWAGAARMTPRRLTRPIGAARSYHLELRSHSLSFYTWPFPIVAALSPETFISWDVRTSQVIYLEHDVFIRAPAHVGISFAGFVAGHWNKSMGDAPSGDWRGSFVVVPYWMLAMLFAICPALLGITQLGHRRRRHLGLCPSCGYDLRATPDRCPECRATPAGATT